MTTPLQSLIDRFVTEGGSDLYLIAQAKPSMDGQRGFTCLRDMPLSREEVMDAIRLLISPEGQEEFAATFEYNTAIDWHGGEARLRINLFMQRQMPGMVLRRITTRIPTIEEMKLPKTYASLIMERRGLVLIVGPTGSGKSTSIAAMIDHRNQHGSGHIVTIEDPVEFVHPHKNCIITQRDVGVDTLFHESALKNALRQAPDVIMTGEMHDAKSVENAISFAETGHLVVTTMHAGNTAQALERMLNFFPQENHRQILLNLSLNLRGILSQRLVETTRGTRALAVEIMLNQGLIRSLIQEGKIADIRDCIEKGHDQGMQSFDQALFELFKAGQISEEQAFAESDNPANMRVQVKQADVQRKLTALHGSGGQM